MKLNKNNGATILGALVAIATAWMGIDWVHFHWTTNNVVMLCLSAVIALGGYQSTLKPVKKRKDEPSGDSNQSTE